MSNLFLILCVILLILLCFKPPLQHPIIAYDNETSDFIIPNTLGAVVQGCNNMYFYGSMNKIFKSGIVKAKIITNGATTRTKSFDAHHIITKKEYSGMGFEAYFHTFNLKQGDIVEIEANITAKDGSSQYISKVFRLDDEMCDTVANQHNFQHIWGYNKSF